MSHLVWYLLGIPIGAFAVDGVYELKKGYAFSGVWALLCCGAQALALYILIFIMKV
jgi:hypothetical protein